MIILPNYGLDMFGNFLLVIYMNRKCSSSFDRGGCAEGSGGGGKGIYAMKSKEFIKRFLPKIKFVRSVGIYICSTTIWQKVFGRVC